MIMRDAHQTTNATINSRMIEEGLKLLSMLRIDTDFGGRDTVLALINDQ